jgi:hypothetical protein
LQERPSGIRSLVSSQASDGALAQGIADRAKQTNFATWLGVGALLGAVAGAVTATRSKPDDVISGVVSIDLLKKVELLTIRLRLDRS